MTTPRSTATSPNRSGTSRFGGRWVVAGVLAVLAVVFVVENAAPVAIRVIIPVVVMPLWTALVAMLVVGGLIGMLLGRRPRR